MPAHFIQQSDNPSGMVKIRTDCAVHFALQQLFAKMKANDGKLRSGNYDWRLQLVHAA